MYSEKVARFFITFAYIYTTPGKNLTTRSLLHFEVKLLKRNQHQYVEHDSDAFQENGDFH